MEVIQELHYIGLVKKVYYLQIVKLKMQIFKIGVPLLKFYI
jgi:hypothetical protein